MINKLRILAGTAISAAMLAATPAHAGGVPVIDPAAIARIRETVSVATKQLAAVQQQVQQVQQMRNTIGQIGPGSLGKMLQGAGIDFTNPTGAFKDIGSLAGQVQSMSSQAANLKIGSEGSLSFAPIKDLATGREAAAKLFYYNGGDLSQQTIGELRQRRGTMVRESALSGYGAAASMKADLTKSQEVAAGLSAQAKDATDLRGDVQANTATMLAMYSELAKQTAIQAQMLEIESAQTLAADSVGRRSN
jgi:type IV secretion system protein VirB5